MVGKARLSLVRDKFMANLDDGRHIESMDILEMARSLYRAGVGAGDVEFEWHAGQRLATAGQRAALLAELRSCASVRPELAVVAAAAPDAAAA